ncbi:MAG: hypothetical protein VCA39_13605 [Pseudomonas sp.]|jgi:hypothetical protein|uniref:hypothetical protein n=1 Tax=Pseudomonas sp. TaxID=306 RepID=UPI0039829B38
MYLEKRLIAMLDVLGLSRRLNTRADLEATSRKYSSLIHMAKTEIFSGAAVVGSEGPDISNFEVGEFVFDNLVLVSHPLTTHTACQFTLALTLLMERFALADMPLRGAIGIGDYCLDPDSKVFLSNIFKALSAEEARQNWAGCVVLEDAAQFLVNEVSGPYAGLRKSQSDLLLKMEVPAKVLMGEEPMGKRWCLNWMHMLSPTERRSVLDFLTGDPSKRAGVEAYLAHLTGLPPTHMPEQPLAPEFLPAVAFKTLCTRANMRFQFVDEAGEAVKPGVDNFQISVIDYSVPEAHDVPGAAW